jgi:hypothetical protein
MAVQERIIAEEYVGDDGIPEHFKATMFIVMCNRCVTCVVAGTLLLLSGQSLMPQAPIWNFVAVSGVCDNLVVHKPSTLTKRLAHLQPRIISSTMGQNNASLLSCGSLHLKSAVGTC